jgi:endonuclease YncB( thermonuclease family)
LAVILLVVVPCQAAEIPVKVVAITDGDTVGVIDAENRYFKVRLVGIDAPEKKQPFSAKSKEALSAKVFEKYVVLDDRYGRTLGVLLVDGKSVNQELVAEGWAWQYVNFDKTAELREAQESARKAKLGLWADREPVAPLEFRKKK